MLHSFFSSTFFFLHSSRKKVWKVLFYCSINEKSNPQGKLSIHWRSHSHEVIKLKSEPSQPLLQAAHDNMRLCLELCTFQDSNIHFLKQVVKKVTYLYGGNFLAIQVPNSSETKDKKYHSIFQIQIWNC